ADAEQNFKAAWEGRCRTLRHSHPATARSVTELASVAGDLRRRNEAQAWYRKALEARLLRCFASRGRVVHDWGGTALRPSAQQQTLLLRMETGTKLKSSTSEHCCSYRERVGSQG
ncbi:Klc, partial [Symbiodinium microadriaticum]